MKHSDRENLIAKLLEEATAIREAKGNDYSGKEDANANFKRLAKQLGLTPLQICWVYLSKHHDAIATYVKDGKIKSEPIQSRIIDEINYLLFIASLIEEEPEEEPEEDIPPTERVAQEEMRKQFDW